MRLLGERIIEGAAGPGGHDYKTRLQELCARTFDELPRYHHVSEGPDHAKRFAAVVSVNGEALGRGEGRSKKQAEQAAARMAWEHLASGAGLPKPEGAEGPGPTDGSAAEGPVATEELPTDVEAEEDDA